MVIGHVGNNAYLTAVITYRNEKVRIISARKSSKKEVDVYGND
ncbi:Ribonuclease toxin, BrnT, of type II toxin-antitoxin system [Olsenella sp. kh2p3]|nr:Ribonuclease toxin, BrnT, of type II toxin-antitoxin system [Olsenella sp. kh2p3]